MSKNNTPSQSNGTNQSGESFRAASLEVILERRRRRARAERLKRAGCNFDRPLAELQAEGVAETLEQGNELDKPWVETGHTRVYYASEDDQAFKSKSSYDIQNIGVEIAEAFPKCDVVMTIRFKKVAIACDVRYDLGVIHLDIDPAVPAHQHIEGVARAVHNAIEENGVPNGSKQ